MKNNLCKLILLVMVGISLMLFTGCWNRKELSQLGILGAVGIDLKENRVQLTFEVLKPLARENRGGINRPAFYFRSEGHSLLDATKNATMYYNKDLFWSHVNIYFFSEESLQDGLMKYLDYFNRNHEHRRYVHMAIAKDTSAHELVGIDGAKEVVPSFYVEDLFDNYEHNGKSVSIKMIDFFKLYYAEGIEPVMGVAQLVKKKKIPFEDVENEDMPSVEGAAVFRNDKLMGFLDGLETLGFNLIVGKIRSGITVSPSADYQGINSVEIIHASSNMDIEMKDGKYHATINVEIAGNLNEETGKKEITDFNTIQDIEDHTSNEVKQQILNTIKKVQAYQTDIFGFGMLVHRKYSHQWKKDKAQWNDIFSTLKIEVSVKTNIARVGVANEQLTVKEN